MSVKRFIEHNKEVPIVSAEWLNKNKRPVTGAPNTWIYHRLTLDDGTTYILHADDVETVSKFNWKEGG